MAAEQGILFDLPPVSGGEKLQMQPGLAEVPQHVPYDAIEVLEDNQFHASMTSPDHMSMDDYSPLTFWINGKAEQPLSDLEDLSSEPCHRLDFLRDQGSWGREGSDLSCKGKIIVDEREIPARLITLGGVVFFHKLNEPQQPSWS